MNRILSHVMTKGKGQSAMEFLMTYGWVLLIVIVVIGVLVSLGFFQVSSYQRSYATGFIMLGSPEEWRLDETGIFELVLNNELAVAIEVKEINATLGGETFTFTMFNCTGNDDYLTIIPGDPQNVNSVCTGFPGPMILDLGGLEMNEAYSLYVLLTYEAEGVDHIEAGQINGFIYG